MWRFRKGGALRGLLLLFSAILNLDRELARKEALFPFGQSF